MLARVIETLSGAVKGKTFLAGDRFSAADLYIASMLNFGMMFGNIEKRPEFEAFCANHNSRPAAIRAREKSAALSSQAAWKPA